MPSCSNLDQPSLFVWVCEAPSRWACEDKSCFAHVCRSAVSPSFPVLLSKKTAAAAKGFDTGIFFYYSTPGTEQRPVLTGKDEGTGTARRSRGGGVDGAACVLRNGTVFVGIRWTRTRQTPIPFKPRTSASRPRHHCYYKHKPHAYCSQHHAKEVGSDICHLEPSKDTRGAGSSGGGRSERSVRHCDS